LTKYEKIPLLNLKPLEKEIEVVSGRGGKPSSWMRVHGQAL
jgi:hypothetical protein